jgi:hypothetical protein
MHSGQGTTHIFTEGLWQSKWLPLTFKLAWRHLSRVAFLDGAGDEREIRFSSCYSRAHRLPIILRTEFHSVLIAFESRCVKRFPIGFCISRVTGVALAVGLSIALSQSSARASCGDYLTHPTTLERSSPSGADVSQPMSDSSKSRGPCSGLNCSRGSEPLPLVPITPPTSNGDQWGCCDGLEDAPTLGAVPWSAAQLSVHPVHRSFPLERPPRLSLSPISF